MAKKGGASTHVDAEHPASSLVEVATALELALKEYASVVHEAETLEITSEKTVHRAKALLEGCVTAEQRLAEKLHAFAQAMRDVQARQEECAKKTVEAARKIEARVQDRAALLERFAALGASTRAVDAPVAEVMSKRAAGAPPSELLPALAEVVARTESTLADASAVAKDAEAGNWKDIAREAHSLEQQLAHVRNEILIAQRELAARSPS